MPTIHFIGRVVPSSLDITISDLPKVDYRSAKSGLEAHVVLTINNSSVDVACSTNRYTSDDLELIHKVAFDLARAAVDVIAFSTGYALTVVFDKFIDPGGVESLFFVSNPSVAPLCTAYLPTSKDSPSSLGAITSIVFREPPLFMALDDLIGAISLHHLSFNELRQGD